MTPDSPPMMKMAKKPSMNRNGVAKRGRPPQMVAIQQKNAPPVGVAIMALAAVKKLSPIWGMLVANMWFTQSPNPRNPVATSDSTIAGSPKIARRVNVAMMVETYPRAGMKMM